jgi:hypothetical protein
MRRDLARDERLCEAEVRGEPPIRPGGANPSRSAMKALSAAEWSLDLRAQRAEGVRALRKTT